MLSGFDPANDRDDQISEVDPADQDLTQRGYRHINLAHANDVSLSAVRFYAGEVVEIDVDGSDDAFLRLFNDAGEVIAAADNGRNPNDDSDSEAEDTKDPYLRIRIKKGGFYFIGLSDGFNRRYDPITGAGDRDPRNRGEINDVMQISLARPDLERIQDRSDSIREASPRPWESTLQTVNGTVRTLNNRTTLDEPWRVNIFRLSLTEGRILTMHASGANPLLRLFDADGNELEPLSTQTQSSSSQGVTFTYAVPETAAYYAGISRATNPNYNPITGGRDNSAPTSFDDADQRVSLLVIEREPSPEDINDQISEAEVLLPSSSDATSNRGALTTYRSSSSELFDSNDVQMWEISLGAGDVVNFYAVGRNPSLNEMNAALVRVFDSSGNELERSDLIIESNSLTTAKRPFVAQKPGKYFVGISTQNNDRYDPITGGNDADEHPDFVQRTFTLYADVESVAGSQDSHDTIREALQFDYRFGMKRGFAHERVLRTGVAPKTELRHGEVLVYRIGGDAGDVVDINVDTDGGADVALRLFDSRGREIRTIHDRPGPDEPIDTTDPFLRYRLRADGPIYVGVSEETNLSYHPKFGIGDTFLPRSQQPEVLPFARALQILIPVRSLRLVFGLEFDRRVVAQARMAT